LIIHHRKQQGRESGLGLRLHIAAEFNQERRRIGVSFAGRPHSGIEAGRRIPTDGQDIAHERDTQPVALDDERRMRGGVVGPATEVADAVLLE